MRAFLHVEMSDYANLFQSYKYFLKNKYVFNIFYVYSAKYTIYCALINK